MATKTHAEHIADRIVKDVRAELGAGIKLLSPEIPRAMAHSKVCFVILGQDETLQAGTVLEYMRALMVAVDTRLGF